MKELVKISCYIEEYSNQNGKLCARLRDKASNKKVVLMGHNTDKNHLLRFLTQAKIHQDIMPTIYAVSYTHLDVYKRQHYNAMNRQGSHA